MSRMIATKMVVRLGCTRFVTLANVTGTHADVKEGDLSVIVDHFKVNASNPHFGHNLDSWGLRFYDCSKVYTPEWVDPLQMKANSLFSRSCHKTLAVATSYAKPYVGMSE